MNIEITLDGHLVGPIWMPAVTCAKRIEVNLKRERSRIVDTRQPVGFKASLRNVVDLAISENGGDFQHCKLTKDSCIRVRVRTGNSSRCKVNTRFWPITAFPSLTDLVIQCN